MMNQAPTNQNNQSRHLLSIVTINKNNSDGVERTIKSLLPLSTDSQIEFIFVDGGSSDSSLDSASKFYSPNCLISEADNGIYAAMNKGLSVSTGRWVLWLNSGDELSCKCWPKLRACLVASKSSVICGAADIIDHISGQRINTKFSKPTDLPWSMVNHSSTVFLRSRVLLYRGYNEKYQISADRELLVRMFIEREPIEFTEVCFSRFWLGGISGQRLLLRTKENLKVDLDLGLISALDYQYGVLRNFIFFAAIRPAVSLLRKSLCRFGIRLPPLGAYAGFVGELPRDAFKPGRKV
jgi:glycosyltransferase involved in cell wall biosynthesis